MLRLRQADSTRPAPSGPNASAPAVERIGLLLPLLAVAFLFLLPAAEAAANAILTVEVKGFGRITSADGNIHCSSIPGEVETDCSHEYVATIGSPAPVDLTATPSPISEFTSWTGTAGFSGSCEAGAANPCHLDLRVNPVNVTATFQSLAEPPIPTIEPLTPGDFVPEESAGIVGVTGYEATLHGTVNPNGSEPFDEVGECHFEYLTEDAYDKNVGEAKPGFTGAIEAECDPATVPPGTSPTPVEATVTGLQPHRAYRVRLSASKAGQEPATAERSFVTPAAPPQLLSVSARPGATVASLYAALNPNNEPTSYRFEYGETALYGRSAPFPAGSAGQGSAALTVAAYLEGLSPETDYHFRIVAENEAGAVASTDQTFTTEAPLPARGYELVTTGFKNDADAITPPTPATELHVEFFNYGLVAADGERVEWDDRGTAPNPAPTNGTRNLYISSRDGVAGWTSPAPIVPPGAGGSTEFLLRGASANLSAVATQPATFNPATGATEGRGALLYRAADGAFTTIYQQADNADQPSTTHLSPDGSRVFFQTRGHLLPSDTHLAGAQQLYAWSESSGLHLAGIDSSGAQVSACGAVLAGGGSQVSPLDVSSDGSRVLFMSPDPAAASTCSEKPNLYLREGGKTISISKPPAGVPDYGAAFVDATPDLSKAFFVTETALPDNDQTTPEKTTEGPGHADLYRYDSNTNKLTRLSVGPVGFDDARLSGIAGSLAQTAIVSSDGRTVYFTGLGQLVPGQPPGPAGTVYLYRWHEGQISYVTLIQPGSSNISGRKGSNNVAPLGLGGAEVSADGAVLLFSSTSRLTPYDNQGAGELYRYDAATGRFDCPSCAPTGAAPDGSRTPVFRTNFVGATQFSPFATNLGGLSADGSTVVFASTDRLLPEAVNTNSNSIEPLYNVYAWHDGTLSLVSTGSSPSSDFLLGTSESGRDVFFATQSRLSPADRDGAYDVYDARVGGGFPGPPQPPPPCEGEDCRGSSGAVPSRLTPGSTSLRGVGNLAPGRRCAKSDARSTRLVRRANRLRREARGAVGPVARRLLRRANRLAGRARAKGGARCVRRRKHGHHRRRRAERRGAAMGGRDGGGRQGGAR